MKRFLIILSTFLMLLLFACSNKSTKPKAGLIGNWSGTAFRYFHFDNGDSILLDLYGNRITLNISGDSVVAKIEGRKFFGSDLQLISEPNIKFFTIWLPEPFNDTLFFEGKRDNLTLRGILWDNERITGFWVTRKQ